ncbi:MAG: UDP-N-acetylmuramate--L-alanine ligase [Cyclobacteriaceae bacterium]|nr:UDP-N-acetylmuramate--L-alanine ligase [Cytophagales bacterium]MCZ8327703.1 UDP-N-acetylmuramate--L-alanine ligase [Cyclobacteriaceae bacterium]
MKLDQYDIVYFLGIGGIGMSAQARWFIKKGLRVYGYDKTKTTLTEALEQEGMKIHYDDAIANIPNDVIENKSKTLVVFTPAIPKDHQEHQYLKDQEYTIIKRSEVLGLLTKNYKTIAVAGTHGKTTTSSMVAHILKSAGKNMVAFLGGITANYNSNLVMEGEVNTDTWVVAEADEFDRSFLRLFPHLAIITSADPDHLDIYGDHQAMIVSFKDFINQVDKDGLLVIHESVADLLLNNETTIKTNTYSISRGEYYAENIVAKNGFFEFDLHGFKQKEHVELGVPGFHNVENAIAAAVVTHRAGISLVEIKKALASFTGVKRRFEFIIRTDKVVFVDDYAHHPTEIDAFLKSLKSMYPRRKLTVIFQPHLYTRTRDFMDGFAKSLSIADELLLMDIYPARELPLPGITSEVIFEKVTTKNKTLCTKATLISLLNNRELDLVATVGAGDIDTFVQPIKEMLEAR